MEIGSLFFALGFKSKGTSELKQFESATEAVHQTTVDLTEAFDGMIYLMEKMAVKIGAITQEELDLHHADLQLLKDNKAKLAATTALVAQEKKTEEPLKTNKSLLGLLHGKLVEGVGKLNAYKLELTGAASAVVYFTKKASDMAVELDKLSAFTGIPTQKMEQLGAMASQAGSSVEDMAGAIQHLQQQSLAIRMGQSTNLGPYMFLGLDPHSDPVKMLQRIQDKMSVMPRSLWMKSVKDLGLSDSLIYFIMNAGKFKPPADGTVLNDKEIARLKDYNFYFNRVFDQSKRVLSKLGATIAPFASTVLYAFDRIGQMVGKLLDIMSPYEKTIDRILIGLGVLAGAALLFLAPWIVGLGLFLIAAEDIYSFFKGDRSLFGSLLAQIKDLDEWIDKLLWSAGALAEALPRLLYVPIKIFDAIKGTDTFKSIDDFVDGMVNKSSAALKSSIHTNLDKNYPAPIVNNSPTFNIDGSKDPKATAEAVGVEWSKITNVAMFQQPQTGH